MARRSKISTPASGSKNDLGISDLRLRLNFLEKENDKLIKQIEASRAKLHKLNDSIKEVSIEITQRIAPFRHRMMELDSNIHDLFKEIATGRKLGKKSRKDLEAFYYHLQADGLLSPKPYHIDIDLSEESDPNDEADSQSHESRSPQLLEDIPNLDRDELRKIRQIYLRLADSFHPDKVTDPAQKEYCTEVMKEINLAYKNGDLARLLAIAKQQELGEIINHDSVDDLTRQCAKVEADHNFLKNQLDTLKRQLKLTKKTQQGEMTAVFKKISKYGRDPLEEALREIESQITIIEQLHQFVVDFRDRRITIQEFLRDPSALMHLQDLSED